MGDELRRLANRVYNGERIGRERIGRERPVRGRPVIERRVIEIRKREEKGIYVEKSLDLLRGCSAGVLRIIYDEFPLVFNIKYTSEKLNFIALNYPTKDIENAIIRAEDQIKREHILPYIIGVIIILILLLIFLSML